jgi:hypothetical protein
LKESPSLEVYRGLKRSMALWTSLAVAAGAAVLAAWNVTFALALLAGGAAGIANAFISMYGNERLLDRRNVAVFVLSSFLRLCVFGIVPVALAARVPSFWIPLWYFIGFFTPLVLFGLLLRRADTRK